jgi:aspartyl-tRNA(Asn)/glutamyl-tRNA(Gln) amidotransferase subunit B
LVGQIMKASQGKANPGQVNELLRKKLGWYSLIQNLRKK